MDPVSVKNLLGTCAVIFITCTHAQPEVRKFFNGYFQSPSFQDHMTKRNDRLLGREWIIISILGRIHYIYQGGIFGGILKFYDGKRKDGKNFWRQEGGDAIERFSIVMLLMNHYIREVPDFLMSFTLCSNKFYLHYHYHLYFSPALNNNVTDCLFIIIIIITIIIITINHFFSFFLLVMRGGCQKILYDVGGIWKIFAPLKIILCPSPCRIHNEWKLS